MERMLFDLIEQFVMESSNGLRDILDTETQMVNSI